MKHLFADQQAATILQIFCICLDKLRQFKGNIAFWGEIDRQGILPNGANQELREAVKRVKKTLWDNGSGGSTRCATNMSAC